MEIRIYLLGPLAIERRANDDAWTPLVDWTQARTTRSVLRRLLTSPGRRATRGQIQEDLWPDLDPDLADRHVDNAISQIRAVVGRSLLTRRESSYELAGQQHIWTDLDECILLLREAENVGSTTPGAVALLERARVLLERGPALEGEEGTWRYGIQRYAEDLLRQCRFWLAESYKHAGKYWQAGQCYQAMITDLPPDEEALLAWLALLNEQGKHLEAKRRYDEIKAACECAGIPLSGETERQVCALLQKGDDSMISRRSALILFGGAGLALALPGDKAMLLFADELLTVYARGLAACWKLFFNGSTLQVGSILPLYRAQLSTLASQPSALQPEAARLASHAWQLTQELSADREDFGTAHYACQQAILFAQLAGDAGLQVAASIRLANTHFHRKESRQALAAYEQAMPLLPQTSPLLQGRVHAGMAEVYGMRGQRQEALQAIGLAQETYPEYPENDPAFAYTHATRYELYVFGEAQTYLFLGEPEKARQALEYAHPDQAISQVDLLYYRAQAQFAQGELEAATAALTEAAQFARELGSRLYFGKLSEVFETAKRRWPYEATIQQAEEAFTPWGK